MGEHEPTLRSLAFHHFSGKYESLDGGVKFNSTDQLHVVLDSEGLRINYSSSDLDPARVISAIMESRLSVTALRSSLGL